MNITAAVIQQSYTSSWSFSWGDIKKTTAFYTICIYRLTRLPGGRLIWRRDRQADAAFHTKVEAIKYIDDQGFVKLNRKYANIRFFWYKEGDL